VQKQKDIPPRTLRARVHLARAAGGGGKAQNREILQGANGPETHLDIIIQRRPLIELPKVGLPTLGAGLGYDVFALAVYIVDRTDNASTKPQYML
jgi:hypothetical protein